MVVSAVRQAEDDDDLIVRAYETGKVVPRDEAQPVRACNLLEWAE